uniref:DYW domain-containing protein n=1 Tax=Leersia perrieri TaxID=77586 RepID=A0A0D9XXH5_9ORYZ
MDPPPPPPPPPPPRRRSPEFESLLLSGPRLGPLKQAHARLVVSGHGRSLPLITKLATLAVAAGAARYAYLLAASHPCCDSFLLTSLSRAAAHRGLPAAAVAFYRRLLAAALPFSSFAFTAVAKACADLSALRAGMAVHAHSVLLGFGSDRFVQTAMVVMYSKCGQLPVARKMFDGIRERSVVAWNAMISGYEQNGLAERAIEVYREMQVARVVPDSATFVATLSACAQAGALDLGREVEGRIVSDQMDVTVFLGSALVNMYARCGLVNEARDWFDRLQERNVVTWTSMITGYGMHGHGREAIKLFHLMRREGPTPNDVTFVAVLAACAHAGLVSEGRDAFDSMKRVYGLVPRAEHYCSMVDMYGRAGLLDDAMQFIHDSIPGEPGSEVWTAMLGACKMHKNFNLGVEVAERLIALEPQNPSHRVLLSNIYALSGKMYHVEKVRNVMIKRRLKKQIGYSLIELGGTAHLFRMGEKSHQQTREIYQYLEELIHRITDVGYVPETDSVLHELEEEEREVSLRYHSEKLAVAYGLMMSSGSTAPIRIDHLCMD